MISHSRIESGFLYIRGGFSMTVLLVFVIIMNLIGYIIMNIDKQRAKRKEYRISEKTLWTIAILFGAIGMTVGMRQFRHKTKHAQFKIGLPVLSLVNILVVVYLLTEL